MSNTQMLIILPTSLTIMVQRPIVSFLLLWTSFKDRCVAKSRRPWQTFQFCELHNDYLVMTNHGTKYIFVMFCSSNVVELSHMLIGQLRHGAKHIQTVFQIHAVKNSLRPVEISPLRIHIFLKRYSLSIIIISLTNSRSLSQSRTFQLPRLPVPLLD